jgi:hypothetical protein
LAVFLLGRPCTNPIDHITANAAAIPRPVNDLFMPSSSCQNLQVSEEEVVGVRLANKPGTLAAAASKLGSAGVNISHGYTGAEEGSKEQLVVLAVSDLKQATKVLK